MKKVGFLVMVLGISAAYACNSCYDCRLEELTAQGIKEIDTLETCDYRWVKENNVPADETYFQSWRCKPVD